MSSFQAGDTIEDKSVPWAQIVVASVASVLVSLSWFFIGWPIVALAAALVPIAMLIAARNVVLLCLAFVIMSFFRIHEVFPVLMPLRIPQLLAILTLAVLGWQAFITREIRPFWSRELSAFSVFFALVTIGVFFATNRPTAMAYWTATYSKIGVMTIAIAWTIATPRMFKLASYAIVCAGATVATVAVLNKINGIGLVEGTRVTIGRDIRSVLGDPNDLSLVLLFPLSFAISLIVSRQGWMSFVLGGVSSGLIASAIIATQSRGGLLGMVAVFAVFGARLIKSRALLMTIGVIGIVGLYAMAGISDRASGGAAEGAVVDESAMGRVYAWGAAWKMALTRPLTGVGLDNFVSNYFFYSDHWDGLNHAVHSTWFGVLGETGFPGFIAFVTMIVLVFHSSIQANRILSAPNVDPVARGMGLSVLAGLAGFCASGTFLTQGFTWPVYILVGLTAAVSRYAKDLAQLSTEIAKPS